MARDVMCDVMLNLNLEVCRMLQHHNTIVIDVIVMVTSDGARFALTH